MERKKLNSSWKFAVLLISLLNISCEESEAPKVDRFDLMPSSEKSKLPFLTKTLEGELLYSWVESAGDSASLHFSTFDGSEWSPNRIVAQDTNWFVNWADYPSVVDLGDGKFLAHFLEKSGDAKYAYDVKLTMSNDEGSTWSKSFSPHDDGTPTEHGFVSILADLKGGADVVWLDGRKYAEEFDGISVKPKTMTLRAANISSAGEVLEDRQLDHMTCDCCPTTMISTSEGPVAYYRDRSDEQIRDIASVRLNDRKKETASFDGWKIEGCPVNGPKAAARSEDLHALAWFTAANEDPQVRVRFTDKGISSEAIQIDDGNPIGRVDLDWLDDDSIVVHWLEKSDEEAKLLLRSIDTDGSISDVHEVATLSSSRSTGMPQLEILDGIIYFAWMTESGVELRRIQDSSGL